VRLPALLRPYAQVGIGVAMVERKPTVTLGGTDVTSTLPLYGVVLGADMTATEHKPAATVGFGVLRAIGTMYVDVAYRLTYIGTGGAATTLNGLHVGVGVRF
jgi:opacity protein-like surface antigen